MGRAIRRCTILALRKARRKPRSTQFRGLTNTYEFKGTIQEHRESAVWKTHSAADTSDKERRRGGMVVPLRLWKRACGGYRIFKPAQGHTMFDLRRHISTRGAPRMGAPVLGFQLLAYFLENDNGWIVILDQAVTRTIL